MPEARNGLIKVLIDLANIFAVLSVPIGIYVAALLMQLSSDVAVIKMQLVERDRDREKLERLYNEVIELKSRIYIEQNREKQ